MAAGGELTGLRLGQLGDRIAAREVSPVEAVDATLERIEAVDPKLSAFVAVKGEEARKGCIEMF